ncbi:putative mitochondrial pyruvate carrier 2 [Cytospora mali]|uniref:Mitochondrial pyruvate carrier n=1 Tax=Cytospora mali TaxID=578113 RepID=A0A194VE24_CYTMA|nr:putative mitochondrial pyruvate carrier 2 [Valsa mali var. pyri (nom. inval.)]
MASTTAALLRATRPVFSASAATQTRQAFTRATPLRSAFGRQQWGRRWQSSSSTADAAAAAQRSWFQRMWDSPVGLKTVHFWAPVMKWALVLAGIADLARPAEKLSLQQNGALTATGLIWTRWCLIIKPKNYLLAAVNFFLGVVGVIQCTRILLQRSAAKNESVVDKVKDKVASA